MAKRTRKTALENLVTAAEDFIKYVVDLIEYDHKAATITVSTSGKPDMVIRTEPENAKSLTELISESSRSGANPTRIHNEYRN